MMKQSLSDKNVNGGVLRNRSTLPYNGGSFTQEQIDVLERVFNVKRYPDLFEREKLALDLNMPEVRIQNRRKKLRETYGVDDSQQHLPHLPIASINADKVSSA
ncbi:unnamed protein product, partial [Adineta ricciae]